MFGQVDLLGKVFVVFFFDVDDECCLNENFWVFFFEDLDGLFGDVVGVEVFV